jgi:hypothetical protein
LAPLGRNVLLGVLCLLVLLLQKLIGSQGLGILEAWYFEGSMGDGAHFHVGVFLGALDPLSAPPRKFARKLSTPRAELP